MNLANRLPAMINDVKKGKLSAQIGLDWEGVPLSVIITSTSSDEMRLNSGDRVDVLFKASDVILGKELSGSISARNVFKGTISKITESFPLAMVEIDSRGYQVRAEITLSSLAKMGLNPGDDIQVIIKSSELILAKRAL